MGRYGEGVGRRWERLVLLLVAGFVYLCLPPRLGTSSAGQHGGAAARAVVVGR
jgi:hypothetical protein